MANFPEIWKPIDGTRGSYEVSNHGRVRSLDRIVERQQSPPMRCRGVILKPGKDGGGYLFAVMRVDNTRLQATIHRLVAFSFLPPSPSDDHKQINHKNLDKTNNFAWNLEWSTRRDNIRHAAAAGKFRGRNHISKLTIEDIGFIRELSIAGNSYKAIAELYHIHPKTVYKVLRRST